MEPVFEYEDLRIVPSSLPSHVQLIALNDQLLVYKGMGDSYGNQNDFELQLKQYARLKGCKNVSEFKGLVRCDGLVVGFLVTYIEGDNLWNLLRSGRVRGEDELLSITQQIVEVAVGLEKHNFYHQDLKLANIVRRESDSAIFFIDFGAGVTEGMCDPDREWEIMMDGPNVVDAMYILGMTIWWLWNSDHEDTRNVDFDRTKNRFARSIIADCIQRRCETIGDLYCRHYLRSNEAEMAMTHAIGNEEKRIESNHLKVSQIEVVL
jgi:serine/threonine protein kinase